MPDALRLSGLHRSCNLLILQDFVGRVKRSRRIRQKQRANKNTGVMPVFFTEEVSNAFNCDEHNGDLAEWLWQHH
ncbi:hypothetical protein V411_08015 [Escherichia coli LAU-EC6]|uniref:Uncharacterized protein n=5 Tax=Escherichia coli TaxID=562 RepID=A0A0H2V6B4_ECOL6|nr:Hypothetical protein c1315 [Escherichia coli CFT073]ADE89828.1 conserved hypothetical protein [Escherichia coli IHE3034]ADN45828.1 conserved hypothetical protein [Escherichia coli ABU 83972]AER83782.1 hypothetical protein i02_1201 [Escherichia coli str. 'clone D i2']AER88701.1 hypothetical protein i14_1201 [Escherichia coli str. 'clone D i14']AKK32596.1 hypothetical protein APECO18_00235 [Escherichia coli APEC O18]EFM53187.1 hypothetical protein ECNC101_18729 [Escherichia coli NC101]EFU50